jgi:hypothetical protein
MTIRNIKQRLSEYKNKIEFLYSFSTPTPLEVETIIKRIFNDKYNLVIGKERFIGDPEQMLEDIKKVEKYFSNPCNENDCILIENRKISDFKIKKSLSSLSDFNLFDRRQQFMLKYLDGKAFYYMLKDFFNLDVKSNEFKELIYWYIQNRKIDENKDEEGPILEEIFYSEED